MTILKFVPKQTHTCATHVNSVIIGSGLSSRYDGDIQIGHDVIILSGHTREDLFAAFHRQKATGMSTSETLTYGEDTNVWSIFDIRFAVG